MYPRPPGCGVQPLIIIVVALAKGLGLTQTPRPLVLPSAPRAASEGEIACDSRTFVDL
jgi:hypothetical protein